MDYKETFPNIFKERTAVYFKPPTAATEQHDPSADVEMVQADSQQTTFDSRKGAGHTTATSSFIRLK